MERRTCCDSMTLQKNWKSDGMKDWVLFVIAQLIYNINKNFRRLGASAEARSDDNIFKHAQKTRCVVVTVDGNFVKRLRAEGLDVITFGSADKANIIHNKLKEKFDK